MVYIELNEKNLLYNIEVLRNKTGNRKILAVVKANGYGHNDIDIVRMLKNAYIDYIAVATFEEAVRIKKEFKELNVLILGATVHSDFELLADMDITITAHNFNDLKKIKTMKKKPRIHLIMNTGMNRLGFVYSDIDKIKDYLSNDEIEGIYTHLPLADDDSLDFSYKQISLFKEMINKFNNLGFNTKYIHYSNSAAVAGLDLTFSNMVRYGIIIYGIQPAPNRVIKELRPVLRQYTLVTYKKENIAIIPIGYFHGYRVKIKNNPYVYIKNKKYYVIDTFMKHSILKVDSNIDIGDKVEIIGDNIELKDVASFCDTISAEYMVNLNIRR